VDRAALDRHAVPHGGDRLVEPGRAIDDEELGPPQAALDEIVEDATPSERGKQLIEQLELAIEDLEETQAEVETKAEIVAPAAAKEKRARTPRPPRKPLPDNLPVERIVEPAPCACGKCGGVRLRKLGEVVSKTLECEPRRWKIIEHVREKFSCRDCEAITEPPAPSHPIPRGFAGPSRLAMVLVSKFLLHQPLNRQSETYAREGIELDVSTLADRIGACVVTLDPIVQALWAHVLNAERIHADDTTVPVLAKMKTVTGRIWTRKGLFRQVPVQHCEFPPGRGLTRPSTCRLDRFLNFGFGCAGTGLGVLRAGGAAALGSASRSCCSVKEVPASTLRDCGVRS
jgi:transposase